jgi:hypothetical protein
MTPLSGGFRQLSTVVFATTGRRPPRCFGAGGGNNQRVRPGRCYLSRWWCDWRTSLATRWWVRRWWCGSRGARSVVGRTPPGARGEGPRAGAGREGDTDLVVAVAVPALPEVRPAQFFAVIGTFDTPGCPGPGGRRDVVFIADVGNGGCSPRRAGPHPPPCAHCSTWGTRGPHIPRKCARDGSRSMSAPSSPRTCMSSTSVIPHPDFAADRMATGCWMWCWEHGAAPDTAARAALAVAGRVVYVITASFTPGVVATFHVVDVTHGTRAPPPQYR